MRDINLTYYIILAAVVGAGFLRSSRGQYAKTFRMAAVWLVIFAAIFSAYVYAGDFKSSKLYTALFPATVVVNKDGTLQFTRANDGHFHINAKVNGVEVEFLLDTGSSDVTLNKADAQNVGFYDDELNYNKLYSTANGYTKGAEVKLNNIEIGSFQTGKIEASVNQGQLETSLLGMNFLNRLKSYQIEGDRLVFTP